MSKHIIGQSIYQFIVMLVFLFLGTQFLPEELDDKQKGESNFLINFFRWICKIRFEE